MPKLLQINFDLNIGSTGRITEQIGQFVQKEGWESHVCYGRDMRNSTSLVYRIGSKIEVLFHVMLTRLLDLHGLGSYFATFRLVKEIKRIKPDVIQLHNIHGYYLNYKVLFGFLNTTNIPVVWTFHDCWAFTGHCGHFVMAGCQKWKTGCNHCPITRTEYPRSFFDYSNRNYLLKKRIFTANQNIHIVAVSEWLAELVRESFFKDKDIRVITNGVDLDTFHPIPVHAGSQYRILGVSNIWTKEKGLIDFFRLRKMLDNRKYEIMLVGLTQEQIKDLPDGIIGIKRTASQAELVTYYASASVFVNPTYADTFPMVNLEAMACGTPVVSYNTGGSPESIDSKSGEVVEQGNVEDLALSIQMVCDRGKDYYSDYCRNKALNKYKLQNTYGAYLSIYKKLAGGGIILGVAAAWSEIKGINDYIELSEKLASEEKIVLVGVDEDLKKRIPKQIVCLPRTQSVEELTLLYNIADVVLSLSKAETFGLTIAEGLACGTPAIVYDNTATQEMINSDTGVVVPTGDIELLVEAIHYIRKKGKKYYSDKCRNYAMLHFALHKQYNKYLQLYSSLS